MQVDAKALKRMATSPSFYRSQLRIEVSGEVVRYSDVRADWQEADFRAMDNAWLRCVGVIKTDVSPMRAAIERPRGGAKTHDLSCMACWALAFSPRPIRIITASGDKDQAKLLSRAIARLCDLNPWLASTLDIQQWVIRNTRTGSELEVMASDAATGFGQLVDAILIDEFANWTDTESSQRFWQMLASTLSKKRNCLAVSISNAGRVDSWQWAIREAIRESGDWYFHSLTEKPPWISEAQLAEQRRLLPANAYSRLWENVWTSGTDSGLAPSDVEACCVLPGPHGRRRDGYAFYIAACDLGWKHDRTGLVVLALGYNGDIDLAACASWHPADYGGELPFEIVEQQIQYLHGIFLFDELVFDPREATGLSQRLTNSGLPCARVNLSSAVQDEMAKLLLQAFNSRRVRLYRHPELIRDLLSLVRWAIWPVLEPRESNRVQIPLAVDVPSRVTGQSTRRRFRRRAGPVPCLSPDQPAHPRPTPGDNYGRG